MRRPDEVARDLVRQWLAKAEEDLGLARHLAAEQARWFDAAAYHAQQAAEKSLKAVLVRHQVEFPKTHAIGELLDLLGSVDAELARAVRDSTALSVYAVTTRYPGEGPAVTEEEALRAVGLAQRVRDAARASLGSYLGDA